MKNKVLFLTFLVLLSANLTAQKQFKLQSPDQKTTVTINAEERLSYSVKHINTTVLAESPIAMTLDDGTVLGEHPTVVTAQNHNIDAVVKAPFYKKSEIRDHYNQLTLTFKATIRWFSAPTTKAWPTVL